MINVERRKTLTIQGVKVLKTEYNKLHKMKDIWIESEEPVKKDGNFGLQIKFQGIRGPWERGEIFFRDIDEVIAERRRGNGRIWHNPCKPSEELYTHNGK